MSALAILLGGGGAGNGEATRDGMCAPEGGGREPRVNGARKIAREERTVSISNNYMHADTA